jgi:hypothetical protein
VSNNEVAILLNEKVLFQEIEVFISVCEEKSENFELGEFIDVLFFSENDLGINYDTTLVHNT